MFHSRRLAPRIIINSLALCLASIALAACAPTPYNAGSPGSGDIDAAVIAGQPDGPQMQASGPDSDGDGFPDSIDCQPNNPKCYPGAPLDCTGGTDCNCNGIPDNQEDNDHDGYTACGGDCDDSNPMVNPGAVEVVGDNVDNNCNGQVDEPPVVCDSALDGTQPISYAKAIGLCAWVKTVTINTEVKAQQKLITSSFGSTYIPHEGKSFAMISTGKAGPAPVRPDPGTDEMYTHANPYPIAAGCGDSEAETTVQDYVQIEMTIQVPTNANSFSFDFNFMTAEYPDFVCTEFNDQFLALLTSKAFNNGVLGNISFDSKKNPVTVDNSFFTVCAPGSEPSGMATCTGATPLNGTGFQDNGGTGWLTTTAPVQPGEVITLSFIIFDGGDGILDSTAILDNFVWHAEPVMGPVTISRPEDPN